MQNLIPCRFHIEVEAVLKSEGLRATKQRLEIWDELCSTDSHRDIETILADLKKKKINVSRATLYRTIDVFVKHSLLKKLLLIVENFFMSTTKKQSPQNTIILFVKIVEKFLSFMIIKFLQLKRKLQMT